MRLTIPIPETQQAVHLPPKTLDWTEDEFFEFCQVNRDLRIERSAKGEIIVMSPAGGYSGYQSGEVFSQLRVWAGEDGTGVAFDSSTGFRLPNGGMRAPDAAWVELSRLKRLSRKEKEQFIPLCPDFVIEVASPTDVPSSLREKMDEYRKAGLRLPGSTRFQADSGSYMEPAVLAGAGSWQERCHRRNVQIVLQLCR